MGAGGGRFCFVLCIEGVEFLLTDHSSMSAVETAWAATDWTEAKPGLQIEGAIEQEIRPWSNEIPVSSLSFVIHDHDGTDAFGELVWRAKPSLVTRLTAPFDAESGATTVNAQNFGAFPASGTVYIGNSRVTYTSRTATALTIPSGALGTLAPFTTNSPPANFFYPRPAGIGTTIYDTSLIPKVSDTPRSWIGRWCGLWMHRIVGGVLDTKAEAELLFAGKVTGISENSDGATVVQAEDLRGVIRDTTIFQNQFKGFVKEGIKLITGDTFVLSQNGTASNALTVVASGAAGSSQIDAGYHKIDDFLGALNAWMAAEFTAGRTANRWSISLTGVDAGNVIVIRTDPSTNSARYLQTTNLHYLTFLGMPVANGRPEGVHYNAPYYAVGIDASVFSSTDIVFTFPQAPFRTRVFQGVRGQDLIVHRTFELENPTGTWVLDGEQLPHPFSEFRDSGQDRGFVIIDGKFPIFVKHTSDTLFEDAHYGMPPGYSQSTGISDEAGRRYGEDPRIEVKQIVYIGGSFKDVVTKLLCSIQGNGVNHATYDAFPWGCGIPFELLGTPWLTSVERLEQANDSVSMVVAIDRPTKVLDIILDQLILRFAFFVFKSGTLRLVSPKTPNATDADHTLDETNKGAPTGDQQNLAAISQVSREFMRNVVKVEYDRSISKNEYASVLEFRDAGSIAEHGMSEVLSIRCRSAYADYAGSGAAALDLASSLIARAAPICGRPIRLWRRSIDGTLFHACPGDTVSITDEFARDPTTGARGVSSRGATILKTTFDFGQGGGACVGEVDVMFTEEDRSFPMGPCADFDETKDDAGYTDGWHAASRLIYTKQHAYSRSTDDIDASHFTIGDEVLVVEMDPSDPTSADSFSDTIAGVSSNILSLSNGFGSGGRPAFSTSKRYRVVFNTYTLTNTNQRDCAFLADQTDGEILGTIEPNLYTGPTSEEAFTENDLTEKWQNHNDDVLVEGASLSTGNARDLIRNLNSVVNYTSAYNCPHADDSGARIFTPGNTTDWIALELFRLPVVLSPWPSGWQRQISMAARFASSGGFADNTVKIRVSVSTSAPRGTSFTNATVNYPYRQVTFTTTSTSSVEVTAQLMPPVSSYGGSYYVLVEGGVQGNAGLSGIYDGLTRFQLGVVEQL
jgi:hypothetical protein